MNAGTQSMINEIKAKIHRSEGVFAKGVLADFDEDLQRSQHTIKTIHRWYHTYKHLTVGDYYAKKLQTNTHLNNLALDEHRHWTGQRKSQAAHAG